MSPLALRALAPWVTMPRMRATRALPWIAAAALAWLASCSFAPPQERSAPLVIGETFTLNSAILGEARRIHVFEPTVYGEPIDAPLPILCLLDGGLSEDFLHVAGLVQVLVSNGTMQPHRVVGIENTDRRRDLTGPTRNPSDLERAPTAGGSAAFRRFLFDELLPSLRARYRSAPTSAIVGESLAGLFVVETLLTEPDLFDVYVAVDPSLWWNDEALLSEAPTRLSKLPEFDGKRVFLACSGEVETAREIEALEASLTAARPDTVRVFREPLLDETHATVFHPAILRAFRAALAPPVNADRSDPGP